MKLAFVCTDSSRSCHQEGGDEKASGEGEEDEEGGEGKNTKMAGEPEEEEPDVFEKIRKLSGVRLV